MEAKIDVKEIGKGLVYITSIRVRDLPLDMQAQVDDQDSVVVVRNHAGDDIAFAANEDIARHLARENAMCAVRVH